MSNWEWPQWVMATLLVFRTIGAIANEVENALQTDEDFMRKELKNKKEWKINLSVFALGLIIHVYILAKGGFF